MAEAAGLGDARVGSLVSRDSEKCAGRSRGREEKVARGRQIAACPPQPLPHAPASSPEPKSKTGQ